MGIPISLQRPWALLNFASSGLDLQLDVLYLELIFLVFLVQLIIILFDLINHFLLLLIHRGDTAELKVAFWHRIAGYL